MKSKIVRGIINGGVLAAVAALGITVYQLGTKPIVENSQEENSVQMEEELSDGENAEDAAVTGNGWEDVAQDEMTDGAAGDETGLSGASENGADADGVTGSIRETAGSGAAENEGTAGTDGNTMADVNNGSGAENKSVSAAAGGRKVLAIVLLESEMQQITPTPEMQQITEQRLPPQIQPKLPRPELRRRP